MSNIRAEMMAITPLPPTTPPAIAPFLVDLVLEGVDKAGVVVEPEMGTGAV